MIERSKENWTYAIINIPLLYGHNNKHGVNPKTILKKVAHNAKCYRKPFPALDKSKRYLWFELDTHLQSHHKELLDFFEELNIDVYYHRTMNGYHYITMQLFPREQYDKLVTDMKERFNNGTFYYSLRIVPNKWINENSVWYNGNIINNGSGHIRQLQYIQNAINQLYIFNYNRTIPNTVQLLENIFCISRYEFKRALQT